MGRLIDADNCLHEAWQNFYKQEDEHKKTIDGYDIMRDQFYEQSGFECCQQTIVNAPTVEAIPKADYEAQLKADIVAVLEELQLEIEAKTQCPYDECKGVCLTENCVMHREDIKDLIQQKINTLKEEMAAAGVSLN